MLKIDDIDAKILKDLLRDGRKSFDEIAQECDVSKNKIWKCYTKMEKAGIIAGATTQVDSAAFGNLAVTTVLLNVESQHVESIFERVRKIPNLAPIRQYNSRYNIRLIASLKNLKDLDQIKETVRLHSSVIELRSDLWLDVKNNPENLRLYTPKEGQPVFESPPQEIPHNQKSFVADDIDKQITDKLSQDGRMSFRKIAQSLGLSTDTVIRRYQKLVESGAMKVSIQINPEKLGYQANLDFSIAFAFQKQNADVIDILTKIPDVIIIIKTSGDFDLHVTAMVRDTKQQFEIQEEIAKIPNIAKMETATRRVPPKWPTSGQHISTF
ncbi:MAG: Lrp/AsnC family transcriptional regulator [Candidatus Bathyarchaeia archaeon]